MIWTGNRYPYNAWCTDCGSKREIVNGYFICPKCDRVTVAQCG